jgi:electron transport complex protein RnfC
MNSILLTTPAMMQDTQGELPCIRCGACAEVCPSQLAPQQLLALIRAEDLEQAQRWNLEDCIECGCCNAVCPSHIPLSSYYRYAKSELRGQGMAKRKAQQSKQRYEFRNERLERAKREREEKMRKKKEALQAANKAKARAAMKEEAEAAEKEQDA